MSALIQQHVTQGPAPFRQPNTFHPFPRLPKELKDMIWKASGRTQRVAFCLADQKVTLGPWANHKANKVVKTSRDDPRLSVCRASRALTLEENKKYELAIIAPAYEALERPYTSCDILDFWYQPDRDTVYLPSKCKSMSSTAMLLCLNQGALVQNNILEKQSSSWRSSGSRTQKSL